VPPLVRSLAWSPVLFHQHHRRRRQDHPSAQKINVRVGQKVILTVDTQQGTRAALLRDAGSPDRPAVYQPVNVAPGMTTYLTLTIKGA
jgi:hypothetical protein